MAYAYKSLVGEIMECKRKKSKIFALQYAYTLSPRGEERKLMFMKVIIMLSKAEPLVIPTWERKNNHLTGFGIDRFSLASCLPLFTHYIISLVSHKVPKGNERIYFLCRATMY